MPTAAADIQLPACVNGAVAPRVGLQRAIFWAVVLSAYFMIVYNGCNWVSSRRSHVGTLFFVWELHIPFIQAAIFPYVSIDLFFFFSPLLCSDRAELRTLVRRICLAITAAAICFVLFPFKMGTTHPAVGGVSGSLFSLLESFDKPYNLIPSLHVALLCILWDIYSRHTHSVVRRVVQAWFVLILISTLVTDQHHVMDLLGGFILGILCFYAVPDVLTAPDRGSWAGVNRIRNYRVAWNYAAGSLILAILAYLLYPWGLILLWPSAAGALVTLGYFRIGPRIFRKSDGRLPLSSRLLLGPYLIIARIFHIHLKRRCEPFCEVSPGVWIGGKLSHSQSEELLRNGVGAVLDLTGECSETPSLLRLHYLNLPLLDLTPPTLNEMDTAIAFMRQHSKDGVYVHCALGVSRSVCVVAAYLLSLEQETTVDESYGVIRDRRSVAVLKPLARRTLEAYRATLLPQ